MHYITCQTRPDRLSQHQSPTELSRIAKQPNFVTRIPSRISSHSCPAEFRHISKRPNFVTLPPDRISSHSNPGTFCYILKNGCISSPSEPNQFAQHPSPTEFRHISKRPNFVTLPLAIVLSHSPLAKFHCIAKRPNFVTLPPGRFSAHSTRPNFVTLQSGRISSHYHRAEFRHIPTRPNCVSFQTRTMLIASEPNRISSHFPSSRISSQYHPVEFRHIPTRPNFVTLQRGRISPQNHPAEIHHIPARPNFVTLRNGRISSHCRPADFRHIPTRVHFVAFRSGCDYSLADPDQFSQHRGLTECRHIAHRLNFITFPTGLYHHTLHLGHMFLFALRRREVGIFSHVPNANIASLPFMQPSCSYSLLFGLTCASAGDHGQQCKCGLQHNYRRSSSCFQPRSSSERIAAPQAACENPAARRHVEEAGGGAHESQKDVKRNPSEE